MPNEAIPRKLEERERIYRDRLAGTRTLIVLDNAVADAPGLADIVRLCEYLPLAIRIIAAWMNRRTALGIGDVLDELRGSPRAAWNAGSSSG